MKVKKKTKKKTPKSRALKRVDTTPRLPTGAVLQRQVEKVERVDEVKHNVDMAHAYLRYYRHQGLDDQNRGLEALMRFIRRGGELLAQVERAKTGPKQLPAIDGRKLTPYETTLQGAQVSERSARRWQLLAKIPQEPFDEYFENLNGGAKVRLTELLRIARGFTSKRGGKRRKKLNVAKGFFNIDFRDANVPPASSTLVFTDPPYDRKSLPLYRDLGVFAKKTLKPGGSLLVYSGAYALPEIIGYLAESLNYYWICCLVHEGGQKALFKTKMISVHWKPILWFVKGNRTPRTAVMDLVKVPPSEKEAHEWEQGIGAATYYIDELTDPGDLVIDPFAGSGTTHLAAYQLGREAMSFEVDSVNYQKAMEKMEDVTASAGKNQKAR